MLSVSGTRPRRRLSSRKAYLIASGLFGTGSLICGVTSDMPVLLIGRTVQDAGGGLIVSFELSRLYDVVPDQLWGMAFTFVSVLWGFCALTGAVIGGAYAGLAGWRSDHLAMIPLAIFLAASASVGFSWQTEEVENIRPYPLGRMA